MVGICIWPRFGSFYVGLEFLVEKYKEMEKTKIYLTIIILSFLFFCCDPPRYYDYFITNNCSEMIEVKFDVSQWGTPEIMNKIVHIKPDSTKLIYSDEWFQPLNDFMVEHYFKRGIIITKGSDTAKVNYVDKGLWEFKKTSKNHADSYLTVNPEDFE